MHGVYKENNCIFKTSQGGIARFSIVLAVINTNSHGALENGPGVIELKAMFLKIRFIFSIMPFNSHKKKYSRM